MQVDRHVLSLVMRVMLTGDEQRRHGANINGAGSSRRIPKYRYETVRLCASECGALDSRVVSLFWIVNFLPTPL